MSLKPFLVDALSSALDLGIGTPDDVVRHVTPDILATHLPRPLWARLFTACLGAPRVDAQLVVETIGIPNLCEHVPGSIIWACIAEIGQRSLGARASAAATDRISDTPSVSSVASTPSVVSHATPATHAAASESRPEPRPAVLAPPPEPAPPPPPRESAPVLGPAIPAPANPLADIAAELEADATAAPRTSRTSTNRFRPSQTGMGRLSGRRPQAAATPTAATPAPVVSERSRRAGTEVEIEPDPTLDGSSSTRDLGLGLDDSQLVDWQADAANGAGHAPVDDDFSDLGRQR